MSLILERLESEIRDRMQSMIDQNDPDSSLDAKALRASALQDLVDKGNDAGGYLGAGGSYSGEDLRKLTKDWVAIIRLAKKELKKVLA
jgi:hypothetical protein